MTAWIIYFVGLLLWWVAVGVWFGDDDSAGFWVVLGLFWPFAILLFMGIGVAFSFVSLGKRIAGVFRAS